MTRRALVLPWTDLVAVGLHTTDDGPLAEDVHWQFLVGDRLLELPGAAIDGEAVGELQARLPGFDSEKLIRAMATTDDRWFRLWHRDESRWRPGAAELTARFGTLIARLGGDGDGAAPIAAGVLAAWTAPDRRYHDLEHLVDGLRELDLTGEPAAVADPVELALWYHDVIHQPGAADCEERSARALVADATRLGVPATVVAAAAQLVRATAHGGAAPAASPAIDLVLDLDLSILGRDPLRFLEYEHGVEEEYAALPTAVFRRGRARLLAALLARPHLFRTERGRARFEAAARRNLAALLASPRYRDLA